MKNLFSLFLLVGCFTFLASSTTTAQNVIRNYTNCDFFIKVAYGQNGSCTWQGTLTATVPANGQVLLALPPNTRIIASKGLYAGTNGCVFYVGDASCNNYGQQVNVNCNVGCGNYGVSFDPQYGMKIYN